MRAARLFQSSPGHWTGCDPVQPIRGGNGRDVSILTRSPDRVRRAGPSACPPRRTGCFNPHPVTGPGATRAATPAGSARSGPCFNPHPVTGPGATKSTGPSSGSQDKFQSSPGHWTGCDEVKLIPKHPAVMMVSILTRSLDRVRLQRRRIPELRSRFNPHPVTGPGATRLGNPPQVIRAVSILTRSLDRVRRSVKQAVALPTEDVSILTRSLDRVRLIRSAAGFTVLIEFQSSPGHRTGCDRSWPTGRTCR